MLRRLLALIGKELRALFRDEDSRRLLILPVILQLSLFPFAATLEVKNSHIAIYNQDNGKHANEIIQRLSGSPSFERILLVHGMPEIRRTIDNQQAIIAIIFPNNFSYNIDAGRSGKLEFIIDGRKSNSAQIVSSYASTIVNQYNNELRPLEQHPYAIQTRVRHWYNPNLDYTWFMLPSLIGIITTIGALAVTSMSVAREREQGTFEQLLVSPLTPFYIMIGKIIPALIVSLLQGSIILLASIFVYRIPFQGSFILLYCCIIFYGLSLAGVGLFISSICKTQQQAFLGVFGFLMPCILLSGLVSPIENIPEPLQSFTFINPIRHFLSISKGIYLKNLDLVLVWENLWPLLIISLITLSTAYVVFKRYFQ